MKKLRKPVWLGLIIYSENCTNKNHFSRHQHCAGLEIFSAKQLFRVPIAVKISEWKIYGSFLANSAKYWMKFLLSWFREKLKSLISTIVKNETSQLKVFVALKILNKI